MKLTPWVPGVPMSQPALFDYGEFRSTVFRRGAWFWWQYGLYCACKMEITLGQPTNTYTIAPGRSKTRCPSCNGEGVLFQEGQYIPGILSSFEEMIRVSTTFANIELGDVAVSVLREHAMGEMDRLILVTDPVVVSEVVQREASGPIKLRHPVVPKKLYLGTWTHPDLEASDCPTEKIVRIIHARKSDADGNLVAGELVEGEDILVDDETGYIDVPELEDGEWLSLRYHTYQVFRVAGTLKQARVVPIEDGCLLPEAGDGPSQFLLRPQKMGLGALSNPSATFLPPAFR